MLRLPAFLAILCCALLLPPAAGAQTPAPAEETPPAETDDPPAEDAAIPEAADEGDDMSLGEIPTIVTVELTPDMAKRALDLFAILRDKYADANLEDYENLQDFVDETESGKELDADVKAGGFGDVNAWNTAVTTLGFAYSAVTDDQTADIKLQIEDVKNDSSLAQDMKDKMVASLSAMIPSDNNRKIVAELMADPAYADKLKQLEAEVE